MSLSESSRPDPVYIRSGGREGNPMGCGGTCPMCRPYHQERRRRRPPVPPRTPVPGRGKDQPPEDPRHAWLPP